MHSIKKFKIIPCKIIKMLKHPLHRYWGERKPWTQFCPRNPFSEIYARVFLGFNNSNIIPQFNQITDTKWLVIKLLNSSHYSLADPFLTTLYTIFLSLYVSIYVYIYVSICIQLLMLIFNYSCMHL